MILNINKCFGDELVKDVIDFYNKNPLSAEIYISSDGGDMYAYDIIKDIVESSNIPTKVIAYGHIASCACQFFFNVKVKEKQILPNTSALIHQTTVKVTVNENYNTHYEGDRHWKNKMSIYKQQTLALCKNIGCTKEEIKRVIKGEDFSFGYPRLVEMFNYYQENNK